MFISIKPVNLNFIVMLVLFISTPSLSTDFNQAWLENAENQLTDWQGSLENWKQNAPSLGELEERQNKVFTLKQKVDACVTELSGQVDSFQQKLKALGEEKAEELPELTKRRNDLKKQKQSNESELAVCRLLSLGLRELQDSHKIMRHKLLSLALGHREKPVWSVITSFIKQPSILAPDYEFRFSLWPSALVGIITLLVLFPFARHFSRFLRNRYALSEDVKPSSYGSPFAIMFANRLPWIAVLASLAIFAYSGDAKLASAVTLVLLISISFAPLLEKLLCQTLGKCREGLPARVLLDIVLVGLVFYFSDIHMMLLPDSYKAAKIGYSVLLMSFSLWLLWELVKRDNFQLLNSLRIPVAVALISGPVAMLLGYQSLSELLIPGVYGTLIGVLFAWTVFQAGNLFFGMFEPEDPNSNMQWRTFLGYKDQEIIPGLWIGRLLMIIAIVGSFSYWLLLVWNVPHSDRNTLGAYFTEGFPVGAVTVVPIRIITAVLAFFLFLTLARWLRNQLSERWLLKTRLDAGARESIVSLTTYTIVGIALVMALGMAGVNFQNVAIVAGALSVGIGFGLQNIVNNFVSGLILLFERPVKPGDWIVVGTTEGYVKKISIRYTLIQTFDRADVLVPNSELISSQVTNWMLSDSMGRVVAPVGVAYGSDTKLVREILNRIAANHALVLVNDWRVSGPKVLFMGFGESSLNFELRCFIKDIDYRMSVRSDLLFSIDEEFRKAGIEIPFPQRVVHAAKQSENDESNISDEHLDQNDTR